MTTTLSMWENTTGKSKVALAEESTLWKAYLDRGTFKTRTLDKYLSLATLPKKPRWREVIKTAAFVKANATLSAEDANRLNALVEETEDALKNR